MLELPVDVSHGLAADDSVIRKRRSVCRSMLELPIHVARSVTAVDDAVFGQPRPTRWILSRLPAHGLDIVVCWKMPELTIHVSHSSAVDDAVVRK